MGAGTTLEGAAQDTDSGSYQKVALVRYRIISGTALTAAERRISGLWCLTIETSIAMMSIFMTEQPANRRNKLNISVKRFG